MNLRLQFAILLLLLIMSSLAHAGWFPINGWGIPHDTYADTQWVDSVMFNLHGNSTFITYRGNHIPDTIIKRGEFANDTLYFFFKGTTHPNPESAYVPLDIMAKGQFSTFQSEYRTSTYSMPGYFDDPCVGESKDDAKASNGVAWRCSVGVDTAGHMQRGLEEHEGHRQEYTTFPYFDTLALAYQAKFYLRVVDSIWLDQDTIPVCSLAVLCDAAGAGTSIILLADTVLYNKDFSNLDYEPCSLWFDKADSLFGAPPYSPMDYCIYWYGNYTLYADRVQLRDEIYWNLEKANYNGQIDDIVDYWNKTNFPALRYFFLWDEPHLDQFHAFQLVKFQIEDYPHNAITIVSPRYKNNYGIVNHYADFVTTGYQGDNSSPLLVDNYLLDSTKTDSASIQLAFDTLCAWMDTVRIIADTTGTPDPHRDVWYVCQAHSWREVKGSDTIQQHRDPKPQEMWAIVGLGLAHGAKGISYFCVKSRYFGGNQNNIRIHGLLDSAATAPYWVRNTKWTAVADINTVLQVIDTFLLDFEFQSAFRGDSPEDYIEYSNLSNLSEFGLFEDNNNLNYFLFVNRRDDYTDAYPGTSRQVVLGLDGSLHSGYYYLRDCYLGEAYGYDSTSGMGEAPDTLYFSFWMKDCHFKLFQIVPFTCNVEINADSSYTDYAFVKLHFDTISDLSNIDTLRMTVWDDEGETLNDVLFDSTIIWEFDSTGTKIISASFEIISDDYIHADSGYLTPTYCDTITFDTIPPDSNDIEVEDVDSLAGFVNSDSVDLELKSVDANSVRKMRFCNYGFDNLIENPRFTSDTIWTCMGSATINYGYGVIDASDSGKIY